MAEFQIALNEILFKNPNTQKTDLRYPIYGNLFDPEVVTEVKRQQVQLEPAFQFVNAPDDHIYEFSLDISATPQARFVDDGNSVPIWREAAGLKDQLGSLVSLWLEAGGTLCKVKVEAKYWEENIPNVLTLRMFCHLPSTCASTPASASYSPDDGLSITFIKSGSFSKGGDSQIDPEGECFEILVTSVEPVHTYDIFRADFELPPAVTLEPAFRASAERPSTNVKVTLVPTNLRFVEAGLEAQMIMRKPEKPDELSKVLSLNQVSFQFTWQWSGKARVFGFYVPVEEYLFVKNAQALRCPRRVWVRNGRINIDPILFNDPPPG